MRAETPLTIARDGVSAEVDPEAGGRIAQIEMNGVPLLLDRGHSVDPMRWGCYPMVPWAGRIRDGRFRFDGSEFRLPPNDPPHAIHGVGFVSAWTVAERSDSEVRLVLDLPDDERWPFGGRVEQTFTVDDTGLACAMTIAAGAAAMPYSMGWHPWFRKPDEFEFRPNAMYRRDDHHIAVDELIEPPPGPWDDCFVHPGPIRFTIDGVDVLLTSDGDHWVVYDEPEHATCIEPQTAPPDAFNLRSDTVEPGRSAFTRFRVGAL